MNIATYSPALALLYVFVLLWILMGVNLKSFSRKQRVGIDDMMVVLTIDGIIPLIGTAGHDSFSGEGKIIEVGFL